jgi:hypothetical protein
MSRDKNSLTKTPLNCSDQQVRVPFFCRGCFFGFNHHILFFSTVQPVPMQNNLFDCGAFVCRYAKAIYNLRNHPFNYGAAQETPPFSQLITTHNEFQFDANDIAKFRIQFKLMLSNHYCKLNPNPKKRGRKKQA